MDLASVMRQELLPAELRHRKNTDRPISATVATGGKAVSSFRLDRSNGSVSVRRGIDEESHVLNGDYSGSRIQVEALVNSSMANR